MVLVAARQCSFPLFHRGVASALGHARAFAAQTGPRVLLLRINHYDGTTAALRAMNNATVVDDDSDASIRATPSPVIVAVGFDEGDALARLTRRLCLRTESARVIVAVGFDEVDALARLTRRLCLRTESARVIVASSAPWPTVGVVGEAFGLGSDGVAERVCARTTERAFAGALRRAFGLDQAHADGLAYFGPNLGLVERVAQCGCLGVPHDDDALRSSLGRAVGRAPFDAGVVAPAELPPWRPYTFTLHGGRIYAASRAAWDRMGNRDATVEARADFVRGHLAQIRARLIEDPLKLAALMYS